jgi:hypothetical protein
MPRPDSPSPLGSRFDSFLYATVHQDRDASPVTVLTFLARLDFDPWEEAAKLARLPIKVATRLLAERITAEPTVRVTPGDVAPLAARLIALLPRTATARVAPPARLVAMRYLPLYLAFVALIVIGHWFRTRDAVPGAPSPPSAAAAPAKSLR